MKITLVRHTEVEESYHKCYNGHIEIGLSQKGKEDAKRLARSLKINTLKKFTAQTFDVPERH